ncbi:MAG: acetolactate synthase large subunit, partial [Bacteroidota bacterium]|nr:acetolactate synthase large subunit [Bacteroidota bacterium]
INIDIDPACISKNVPVDCPILGDVSMVLDQLEELVQPADRTDWLNQIAAWKEECPLEFEKDSALRPQQVVQALREKTSGEAVVVTAVGQNQMWGAQFY